MKTLFATATPALIILAAAFVAILYSIPAHAAPCKVVVASWYGLESCTRNPCLTANGEKFDGRSLTAAMPDRKHLGERYRVTYAGKSVEVKINDVGPRADLRRGIDLSKAAAHKIGMIPAGVAKVCIERL